MNDMAELTNGMIARGELALAEVRRETGLDPDDLHGDDVMRYIGALEGKVREQAMTLYLAARTPIEAGRIKA
jgi:hypothetical protein